MYAKLKDLGRWKWPKRLICQFFQLITALS